MGMGGSGVVPGSAGTGATPGTGVAGGGLGGSGDVGGSGMGGSAPMGGANAMAGASMGGNTSMAGAGTGGSSLGGMNTGGGDFVFTSAEFMDGDMMPDAYTCSSGDFMGAPSPSFMWSGAPDGTQSYAMVMLDKTLVDMGDTLGYHSAFWNVPASVTSLPIDLASSPEIMAADVLNNGYLGPCPTLGNTPPPHTYTFTLYALPDAMVNPGAQLNAQFVQTLEDAALATAVLTCQSSASLN
jgi:phosphatidylethanolamine-binding protein (PEBP) family uncharacterized protein